MQDPTTPSRISYNCTTIFYSEPTSGSTKHTMVTTYQSKHATSQKTWIFNYDNWRSWFIWASAQDTEKAEHLEELARVCWFQLGKNSAKFHRDIACQMLLDTTYQLTKFPKLRHAMNNVFSRCDTCEPNKNICSTTLKYD